jgi:hypothetical protein
MAEKLLNFGQPFDVPLLDATVAAFYGTGSKEEVCGMSHPVRSCLRSSILALCLFSLSLSLSLPASPGFRFPGICFSSGNVAEGTEVRM